MKKGLGTLFLIIGIVIGGFHFYQSIKFSQNCKGYLKQAADANTVELALERLNKAIEYAEKENLTDGYTSVIYRTENDNVGFWYRNLLACRTELEEGRDGTQLEKTNLLLKIRESLTDEGEEGTQVIIPVGIARYPMNLFWGIMLLIALTFLSLGVIFISVDSYYW